MDRDDFLLAQIDEFREKARELQEILVTKESKAQELQSIVKEREVKADELQQILDERQGKVDGIEAEVARQIDQLIERVNAKMNEIEQSMGGQSDNIGRTIQGDMDTLGKTVATEINSLGRNINDNLQAIEDTFGGTVEETRKIAQEQASEVRAAVNTVNQTSEKMLESLGQLNNQLIELKTELSEKVHTENVKSYRNIQDLFKGNEDKIAKVADVESTLKFIKTFVIGALILNVITSFGFIALTIMITNAAKLL